MARVYATAAEYESYTGQPAPANATRLLARASRLVSAATKAALYDADASGYPSDTDVRAAFRDATAAQVQVWADQESAASGGTDPAAGPWTTVSAGSLSFSRQSAPTAVKDDTELTPEAAEILAELGLEQVVWT
jgi:hypothetical protein